MQILRAYQDAKSAIGLEVTKAKALKTEQRKCWAVRRLDYHECNYFLPRSGVWA